MYRCRQVFRLLIVRAEWERKRGRGDEREPLRSVQLDGSTAADVSLIVLVGLHTSINWPRSKRVFV